VLPLASRGSDMNGLNDTNPVETKDSAKIGAKLAAKRDTSQSCRERASADLTASATMMTANERLILERSAANWNQRADLLDRVEKTARERGDAETDAEDGASAD